MNISILHFWLSGQWSGGETYHTETINNESGDSFVITTLNENNHIEFIFPPNYYSETLTLQVNSYSNIFFEIINPSPSGKKFIGKTYDFKFFTSANVQVIQTIQPITIVLHYEDNDVSGMQEDTLTPYRWGSNDSSWQIIQEYSLDKVNNTITFSTVSFSLFSILSSSPIIVGGRGRRKTISYKRFRLDKRLISIPEKFPQRSESATLFINELKEKILRKITTQNIINAIKYRKNRRQELHTVLRKRKGIM